MTRPMTKRQSSRALISSTVGTTLISIAAVWLVTSHALAPVVATPDTANIERNDSHQLSTHPLYRLSPIPAGADWTS
jgi:hypothetical protein